ncbi:MAG: XTP/dITP diphosphatase [Candidatus Thorarchaeota archaeon]
MSRDRPVLVTQNQHKITELRPLFDKFGVSFDTTDIEKMEIRSEDVEVIAVAAAKHAHETLRRPVIVDDTGFYLDALNGFPGSYAAFALNTIGYKGILRLMEGVENRSARFVTAVAYCSEEVMKSFIGTMQGTIADHPTGSGGFGYDPIFIPESSQKTYAEMGLEEKVRISHRTRAFTALLQWYSGAVDKS